ncbi:recombinase family protein [Williamsia deligens]|uniref:Recombinase family protein n=1 Tax=Williamsia deligens TaxID=321325 RepID=A0ABW3G9I2_9NOCA|nr:recombinase family protein [Williamsia deligens]MCP2196150.1 Site-specific DNA recombinase [Williamsia deligens]
MRAIIYTRVSNDQSGRSTSTDDQERECRAICEQRGWDVAEVLCDNDIGASRWSGKDRPAYQRLAEVLTAGDVLVTWEASRAQRDLAAYVQLRDLCTVRGVHWCYSGRLYDLADGDDRFGTGLDALLAEKEAEQIRTRVLRGKRAAAAAGRPAGRPPFGYRVQRDPDTGRTVTWEPHPQYAPLVLEAIRRVFDGESLWSISRDFTARGIPRPHRSGPPVPAPWVPQRMRVMLLSPSYAGKRQHQGQVVGDGNWEPLISIEHHERLRAILTDPARSTCNDPTARHLLTGIACCGVCGAVMRFTAAPSRPTPRYMCEAHSCVSRRSEWVDELVVEVVLARLETLDPAAVAPTDPVVTEALAEARSLRERLDAFVDQAADGSLSAAALARVEARLLPQIAAAQRRASAGHRHPIVAAVAGPQAREQWSVMPLVDRRALIRAVATVTINPTKAVGPGVFEPDDVSIEWVQ